MVGSFAFETEGSWLASAQLDSTFVLLPNVQLHLAFGAFGLTLHHGTGPSPFDGLAFQQTTWLALLGELQWTLTPQHTLFLKADGPTSYFGAGSIPQLKLGGSHEFAADAAAVLVGYQLSLRHFNVRVDVGYGPGPWAHGLTGLVDLYWRFDLFRPSSAHPG